MKRNENKKSIIVLLLEYHLAGAAFLFCFLTLLYILFDKPLSYLFDKLETIGDFSFLGILDIQISVSFLVISIVTVFAQRNITVYWEDIMQYKLVRPIYTNFNALASYIFIDLLASIILICCGNRYVYLTFFIAILLISFLSLKMLSAYFAGDLIRVELEKVYKKEYETRHTDHNARKNYREHKRKLIQYTLQAIDTNEIDIVCVNMALLYKFNEAADTTYLISKMENDGKIYLLSRVAKECQFIFGKVENMKEYEQLCRTIFDKGDVNSYGYIQSIFKSMGEYIVENEMEKCDVFKGVMSNFGSYLEGQGNKKLKEEIIQTFENQLRMN